MSEENELKRAKLAIRRRPAEERSNNIAREMVAAVEARAKARELAAQRGRYRAGMKKAVVILVLAALAFVGYRVWREGGGFTDLPIDRLIDWIGKFFQ